MDRGAWQGSYPSTRGAGLSLREAVQEIYLYLLRRRNWMDSMAANHVFTMGGGAVNRAKALQILTRAKPELARRYGVVRLALFGSTVRDEAGPDSDVDIVVSFDGPATSQKYFGVQFYLEDTLGCQVDLVTEKALRPELRPYIEREAVSV